MRALGVSWGLLALLLTACAPVPTPAPSATVVSTPTAVTPSPPTSEAVEGAVQVAVLDDDQVSRTQGLVLFARVDDSVGTMITNLNRVTNGWRFSLPPGVYRFVAETHGEGVGGIGPVMGECTAVFTVGTAKTTSLTIRIAWEKPCQISTD